MEKYIGVKMIEAEPMTRGAFNASKGVGIPLDDPAYNDPGYKVVYEDGYVSWSPKEVFDAAYRRIDNMTFGLALEALKKGKKVCRAGWNGKGQYVSVCEGGGFKDGYRTDDFLYLKNAQDKIIPWGPSQGDCFAEDWMVLEA